MVWNGDRKQYNEIRVGLVTEPLEHSAVSVHFRRLLGYFRCRRSIIKAKRTQVPESKEWELSNSPAFW
jgi:hypothetical protein